MVKIIKTLTMVFFLICSTAIFFLFTVGLEQIITIASPIGGLIWIILSVIYTLVTAVGIGAIDKNWRYDYE